MPTRREMLQRSAAVAGLLGGLGLLPAPAQAAWSAAAFEADGLPALARLLGWSAPVESRELQLQGPDLAESGAAVALSCRAHLPGVARLMLLVEKNPTKLCAIAELSDAVEPALATRVKMAQSSDVLAVAVLADGRVLYARKGIQVTIGSCGA